MIRTLLSRFRATAPERDATPFPVAASHRDHGASQAAWRLPQVRLGTNALLLLVALYVSLTQNHAFWKQVARKLPPPHDPAGLALLASLFVALNVLLLLAMAPFSARRTIKPALALFLLTASVCSYFMDSFGVVIDESMIVNALQTDAREAGELLTLPMLLHVSIFGLAPAILLWRIELQRGPALAELARRSALLVLALTLLFTCLLANYKTVSLWARTNRHVRTYVNPTYPAYAVVENLRNRMRAPDGPPVPIATDAVRLPSPSGRPRVVVMVVGETARAANFQLAGYARETNPELAKTPGVVSFDQAWSCGTATAMSVPCMFSRLGHAGFSRAKARREENVLDVLHRTGVTVSWRDNNSDSKGVATRVTYDDFRRRGAPELCHEEVCYDEVLLQGLDDLVADARSDRLVVLHLMGSHGPSYYRRYPPAFRHFVPDCAQDDVQGCSRESIVNAYDNTMRYTDHVLARIIEILSHHSGASDTSLVYLSDHGESLGEDGLYLHGLPYAVAPQEQKHVPLVLWSPSHDTACLQARARQPESQDNLFPTLLGLFGVQTSEYRGEADLFAGCGS